MPPAAAHRAGAPAGEDDSEERQGSPARRRPASGSTSHSRRSSSDSGSGSDKPAAGGGSVQQLAAGSKRAVSYMPFSEGPRNCVGQSLAKMEVLVVLAKLLAAFRWVTSGCSSSQAGLSLHVQSRVPQLDDGGGGGRGGLHRRACRALVSAAVSSACSSHGHALTAMWPAATGSHAGWSWLPRWVAVRASGHVRAPT